jgi:hypothetical protein
VNDQWHHERATAVRRRCARSSRRSGQLASGRRLGGDGRHPVPRHQFREARARPALGHLVDDAGQIGMRIEAGQLRRLDNGIDMCRAPATFVVSAS